MTATIASPYLMRLASSNGALEGNDAIYRSNMGCSPGQQSRLSEWKGHIADLILNRGIGIDECAEKFDTHPMAICKLMGWI